MRDVRGFGRGAALAVSLLVSLAAGSQAQAQPRLLETYVARLSVQDHYNSNGVRLLTAAGIIRQDRANYYEFGRRDPEDQPDAFFSSLANRALLEQMLLNGTISPSTNNEIVNGTPLIVVKVYRHFVDVDVYR
ncbi:MAG TPA: hypothetical protein VKU90_10270 [Caulobacteraceae bacterium]|nr:hypothetical protein [Caulobacteraceae bacterium]